MSDSDSLIHRTHKLVLDLERQYREKRTAKAAELLSKARVLLADLETFLAPEGR